MFELVDVSVRFGPVVALDLTAATLALAPGTTVAVMGPNGSGKTTLLRVVAGLQEPSTGAVDRSPGASVAYVAQHQHQHAWMPLTVREVLTMGRYRDRGLVRPLRRTDRDAVTSAAERLDVADLLGRPFGDLSGGQRQRVLVAGALAASAGAILLDEPITGLDLVSQRVILDVVDAERDAGRLVMLTTHHLAEARHCDRVVLLNTTLVADGAPDDVLVTEHLGAAFGPRLLHEHHHGRAGEVMLVDDHGHGDHDHQHEPHVADGHR